MKKRLEDWMGEDWTVEFVLSTDDRLRARQAQGIIDFPMRTILVNGESDVNTITTTLIHEVMHRIIGNAAGEDSDTEIRVEYGAVMMTQFLRKMGVDLKPLLKIPGGKDGRKRRKT